MKKVIFLSFLIASCSGPKIYKSCDLITNRSDEWACKKEVVKECKVVVGSDMWVCK